ncbi:MAG: amidohydrolase [Desulfuromonadales bacterium]|nr:amidohydrolase [Desulfuromonadales bacterium]
MKKVPVSPDIILFNGKVATQNPGQPYAEALAVAQGRILAVGNSVEILALAGAESEMVDLAGRLAVPGFIDSHFHFYEWALKRKGVKLDDVSGLDELIARVSSASEAEPAGQWIMGQGWNETDWPEQRMPTRQLLDQAVPDHPLLLWRCDLHLAVANSAALALAGIDAGTPDPPEGRIERDGSGEPNGILREMAINLARRAVVPPPLEQIMAAFEDATTALHRLGITGIHDIRLMADEDGADAFRAFQELDCQGHLAMRLWVSLPGQRLDEIIGLGLRTGFGNDHLRVGHVKYFTDGGMGARSAWMIDPYLDAEHGMSLMDMATLAREISKAESAGLAVMVHAIGDRANREVIDIFTALEAARVRSGSGLPAFAHRIEHVQVIRPEDVARLRNLHLALNMTPSNLPLDIKLIDTTMAEKGRYAYAIRPLLDTGTPVMFSSDCPVCDPNPLLGIHAAVTRQRPNGTPLGGWHAENRITVAEALQAYTSTPAAVHNAVDQGVIAAGKLADIAILSEDILTLPPSLIPQVYVEMTLFDGQIVYRNF